MEVIIMPWESILGGATGGVAAAILDAVIFFTSLTQKLVEGVQKRFESSLKRTEELHKNTIAMTMTIDTDLRGRRITVYSELWKKTGDLPKWPRNQELTYQDLHNLSTELRKWYFETGGMYLSEGARVAYGEVQKSLTSVLAKGQDGKVIDSDYDTIRGKCSTLRTELTDDLLSRREAPEMLSSL
jgi:hypothetical protein